jgi:CRISPR-associated protein Cas4
MESYIPISKINDFLYCPKSLYLHLMYENFDESLFHDKPQIEGRLSHQSIGEKTYSTAKRFIVGKEVYSEKYKIMGKIDIYDTETKTLIERKTKVKRIFDGYKFQIYAQYFCLKEMGYEVERIVLRSLKDNKNYEISLPTHKDEEEFEELINKIWFFDARELINHRCPKCDRSIYRVLSW